MKLDENAVLTFRSCLLQCHKTNLKLLQDSSARKVFLIPELQNEFVCETSRGRSLSPLAAVAVIFVLKYSSNWFLFPLFSRSSPTFTIFKGWLEFVKFLRKFSTRLP